MLPLVRLGRPNDSPWLLAATFIPSMLALQGASIADFCGKSDAIKHNRDGGDDRPPGPHGYAYCSRGKAIGWSMRP